MSNLAPGRVLPTLNEDGTRRWLNPRPSKGRHTKKRAIVAWALIAMFVAVPFIQVGGHPLILLDLPNRLFHLVGATFRPTDGVLLMLLLLAIFVAIFLLTALYGRVWCGWGCPQTVYLEFVFRPIERLVAKGAKGKKVSGGRMALKYGIYFLLSVGLSNVFLAYFVGVKVLVTWMTQSPFQHPTGFLVVAVTGGLIFFDFAYFREQMCTVICPYARLQSVLLDERSLIVGYDDRRGEPRGKLGKVEGDCVDCKKCVTTCPTGIDIREGLQLECVACTQCVDACDQVMRKVGRPEGLIRYTSKAELAGEDTKKFRARTVVYPAVLALLLALLVLVGRSRGDAEVTVLRGLTTPYVVDASGVRNQIRVKIENRGSAKQSYEIELLGANDATLIAPENPLEVAPGKQRTTTLFVTSKAARFVGTGVREIQFKVSDGQGFEYVHPYKLLGPSTAALATPTNGKESKP